MGVLCSAAARMGFFPLSLWRGRTADLGRGPAAVVGPLLATAAGAALLARFGPSVAADPVAESLRLALPASALALAITAGSQARVVPLGVMAAAAALTLLAWRLTGRAFDLAAAGVLFASTAALIRVPGDRPVSLLPAGALRRIGRRQFFKGRVLTLLALPVRGLAELRRMGRRQFYMGEVLTLLALPVRGLAQLTRFADAAAVVPAVRANGRGVAAALDAEMEAESTGVRWGVLPVGLLIACVAAAWGWGR